MAVIKSILRKTHQDVVVKVQGTLATGTISLANDLIPLGVKTLQAGTISVSTASTAITGTNTNFTSSWVGGELYTSAGVYLGTIATFTNATSMNFVANSTTTYNDTFKSSLPTQVISGTPTVNIIGVQWSGASGGVITITRNAVTILTLQANAPGWLDFGGQNIPPDTTNNTSNIDIAISAAQAECWLRIHKVAGYSTTIEPEQFGIYDNPLTAGS